MPTELSPLAHLYLGGGEQCSCVQISRCVGVNAELLLACSYKHMCLGDSVCVRVEGIVHVTGEQASSFQDVGPKSLSGTAGGQQDIELPLSALRQVELWCGLQESKSVSPASLVLVKYSPKQIRDTGGLSGHRP